MLSAILRMHLPQISYVGHAPSRFCHVLSVYRHDSVEVLPFGSVRTYSTRHQVQHIMHGIYLSHPCIALPMREAIFLSVPSR